MSWTKIICNAKELQLVGTLNGGQSFRWKHDPETDVWTGVFHKTVWKLRQIKDSLQYQIIGTLLNTKSSKDEHFKDVLKDYFRLDVKLEEHYKTWSKKDENFKVACQKFYGIRMLNQDPVENLFSFICSQNNHISRITDMVEKLCSTYGEQICKQDDVTYYSFPKVEKLAPEKVESVLRELGFGYRAKFIQKSAQQILEWGGVEWFDKLKAMEYSDAKKELIKLHGIGPKVADCISLMSLGHLQALPVDTHVYQIAAQHYLPHLRGRKSVTDKMYEEIGEHFRGLYGDMAGWAHTVLFCADLKKFQKNGDTDNEVKPKKRRKCK